MIDGANPTRDAIPLDGTWAFAPDDAGVGLTEGWHQADHPFPHEIAVPGCWEAQGYHCHTGWYRRDLYVPGHWRGRKLWLRFGGVSYATDVYINGQHVLAHEGMLMPFEREVSAWLNCGETNRIVVRVSEFDYPGIFQSEQLGDKLLGVCGCWTTWGGIYQSVSLEAVHPIWIDDLFLVPDVDGGSVLARLRLRNETAEARQVALLVRVQPAQGTGEWAESASLVVPARGEGAADLSIPVSAPVLWEPQHPFLYRATATLAESGQGVDAVSDRFGMRKVAVEGQQILLNGRPIFLRGWLCDAVYPDQISPTLTRQDAYAILSLCKEYGFNFVRHHTHPAAEVFHEVADELGVLQLEEFASHGSIGHPRLDPTQRTRQQIFATWRKMIERDRNHPSLIAYGINNECWSESEFLTWAPLYRDLYQEGKRLDPTRLIVDNSGGEDTWSVSSDLYDKHLYMFPTRRQMERAGAKRARKYIPKREAYFNVDLSTVDRPCVVTEVGGWSTFPDFERMAARGDGRIPWWLSRDLVRNPRMGYEVITRMLEGMAQAGLAESYPEIVANSERYARMGNRLQVEHLRQTPGIAGYAYCTFNDCYSWTCGIVDNYLGPKSHATDFALYNQPSVLLWPRERWCFWAGDEVRLSLAVSHYGHQPIEDGVLTWQLVQDGRILAEGTQGGVDVACYQVQDLVPLVFTIPSLAASAKLGLRAVLTDRNQVVRNHWDLWAFARARPDPGAQVVALHDPGGRHATLRVAYPWLGCAAPGELAAVDALIATALTDEVVRFLESGGRVLWLEDGTERNCRPYSLTPIVDYHASIVRAHPALASFPNEGWCDLHFHNLLGSGVLDTGYFAPGRLVPIVEAFHVPYGTLRPTLLPFRRKGFLVEAQVGSGTLIATTFALDLVDTDPEVRAMADALVRYLLSPLDEAACRLSGDELREWAWGSVHGAVKPDFVAYSM